MENFEEKFSSSITSFQPTYTITKTIYDGKKKIYRILRDKYADDKNVENKVIQNNTKHNDLEKQEYVMKKTDICSTLKWEYDILRELEHPNIIKMYDYFTDVRNEYLIMESMTIDLFDCIIDMDRRIIVSKKILASILYQVSIGLEYLHQRNIIHRDIKPENILFKYLEGINPTEIPTVKIADFEFCQNLNKNELGISARGTSQYLTPEACYWTSNDTYYFNLDLSMDIWAFGLMIYETLTYKLPFPSDQRERYIFLRRKGEEVFKGSKMESFSFDIDIQFDDFPFDSSWQVLISSMIQFIPSHRCSVNHVVKSLKNLI
jgi:calcium-dependent protein kinase